MENTSDAPAPEALSAVTLKVLLALLPWAVAAMLLVLRPTLDADARFKAEKPTDKASVLPALAVMLVPANVVAPEPSTLPELNWVLPTEAVKEGAVLALRVTLLPASLPEAVDKSRLPLTLTALPLSDKAAPTTTGDDPVFGTLTSALTLLFSRLEVNVSALFFCAFKTETAAKEEPRFSVDPDKGVINEVRPMP